MYKWTVCDPLEPEVIQKGSIEKQDIINTFKSFPWEEVLSKMESANQKEVNYSPSIEFIDESENKAISFSSVRTSESYCFYVFFKRPKMVKKWFGLVEKLDNDYYSDVLDYSESASLELLERFVERDFNYLESVFE